MNLKTLKNRITDCDLQELYEKINLFYKKNEILSHYFQILNITGPEKNMYLEDFSQIKTEPSEFRAACLRFIEKSHEDLKVYDLQELAKLF